MLDKLAKDSTLKCLICCTVTLVICSAGLLLILLPIIDNGHGASVEQVPDQLAPQQLIAGKIDNSREFSISNMSIEQALEYFIAKVEYSQLLTVDYWQTHIWPLNRENIAITRITNSTNSTFVPLKFIHIAKNAGSYIENYGKKMFDINWGKYSNDLRKENKFTLFPNYFRNFSRHCFSMEQHIAPRDFWIDLYHISNWKNFLNKTTIKNTHAYDKFERQESFCVIREPLDRLMSDFHWLLRVWHDRSISDNLNKRNQVPSNGIQCTSQFLNDWMYDTISYLLYGDKSRTYYQRKLINWVPRGIICHLQRRQWEYVLWDNLRIIEKTEGKFDHFKHFSVNSRDSLFACDNILLFNRSDQFSSHVKSLIQFFVGIESDEKSDSNKKKSKQIKQNESWFCKNLTVSHINQTNIKLIEKYFEGDFALYKIVQHALSHAN